MIDFAGAFFQIASSLGGSLFAEKKAKKEYKKQKAESRNLDRKIMMKETGDLRDDITAQYLSSGLNPSSLGPKIKSMYANIDRILDMTYGSEKPYKNARGQNIAGR